MADTYATTEAVAHCEYALTLLPDPVWVAKRGDDEIVVKISDDYYCFICPDDGRMPAWTHPSPPGGNEWVGDSETIGEALVVHFTRG